MNKRTFLKILLGIGTLLPIVGNSSGRQQQNSILIQQSPVAGFQYHRGGKVWPYLRVKAPLTLRREPANLYDERAVAVYWRREKLGYLPRDENLAVSQIMDRRIPLTAKITRLENSRNPWNRITIVVEMQAG